MAGHAGDAAAGMHGGAAEVEAGNGCAVVGEMGGRPAEEDLVGGQVAVVHVAIGQPEAGFEVARGEHLVVQDGVAAEARSVAGDGAERLVEDVLAHLFQ